MYHRSGKVIQQLCKLESLTFAQKEKLISLSKSSNAIIREKVAELMGIHFEQSFEDILYRLTYDKDILVRLEAIDSLLHGSSLKVLQRLTALCENPDAYIRCISLLSHYDVYTNLYGDETYQSEEYLNWLKEILKNETDTRTLLAAEKIKYQLGDESSLEVLVDSLVEFIKIKCYGLQTSTIRLLDEILDSDNIEFFKNKIKYLDDFIDSDLKDRIEAMEAIIQVNANKEKSSSLLSDYC